MTLVKDNSVQAINTALLSVKRDISVLTATKNPSSGSTDETTAGLEPGKTYNINISGNAATADKATTATTAETATNANHATTAENATTAETATTANKVANALTVNGKTYDGSEAVDAGVQTVANGGTGATDAASGFNTLADGVRDSSTPRDDEKMLLKPAETWYKTTCLDFWNYIKGKISFDLGLTKDNYRGKAFTAWQADEATGITYTDGENDSCISAVQSPMSFNNSDENWASYIICNHGNGTTYYHQMLRLPFFSDTIQLQRRVNGELQGWKNVAIMENENTWSGRQNFTTAKASNKMVIPIGAPSQLEDGCIWIER